MGVRQFSARFFFLSVLIFVGLWAIIEVVGAPTVYAFEVGARALGMGGAFTAVADDASAPFWNPAAITQIEHVGLVSTVGAGQDDAGGGFQGLSDLQDLPASYTRAVSTGRYSLGQHMWREHLTPPASGGDYGLNKVIASVNLTLATPLNLAKLSKPAGPGLNFVAVGGGLRLVHMEMERTWKSGTYTASRHESGEGLTGDVGVLARWGQRLTAGFVFQDLRTRFSGSVDEGDSYTGYSSSPAIVAIDPNWRTGVAYRPAKSTILAADLEGPNFYSGKSVGVHLGAEQRLFFDVLSLRGGAAFWSGVPSYNWGVGLKFGSLRLDIGSSYTSGVSNRSNLIGTAIIQF